MWCGEISFRPKLRNIRAHKIATHPDRGLECITQFNRFKQLNLKSDCTAWGAFRVWINPLTETVKFVFIPIQYKTKQEALLYDHFRKETVTIK